MRRKMAKVARGLGIKKNDNLRVMGEERWRVTVTQNIVFFRCKPSYGNKLCNW